MPNCQYECKLDGYRAIGVKSGGRVQLRSRNNKDFNAKYPAIVKALLWMPDEAVIDGEIVALDQSGRPSFNILQNYGSSKAPLVFYALDALIVRGRDLIPEPLEHRREMLQFKRVSFHT